MSNSYSNSRNEDSNVDDLTRRTSGLSMFERPGDRVAGAYQAPHRREGSGSSGRSAFAPRDSGYGGSRDNSYGSRSYGNRDSSYSSRGDSGSRGYGGGSRNDSGREAYTPRESYTPRDSYGSSQPSRDSYGNREAYRPPAFQNNARQAESAPAGVPGEFTWLPRNKALEEILFGGSTHKTGINFEKYDDIPVSLSGKDCPKGIVDFPSSDLHPLVKDNVSLASYTNPTPIQKNSVAIVSAGRDLMACAQTGSGKTAAFLLPILSQLLKTMPAPSNRRGYSQMLAPAALIMAPTRELAMQIFEEARKFTYRSWVRPGVAYGGQPMALQLREMGGGCDLLVATPGRLSDMFARGKLTLRGVQFLVLDEADRMLDMGFEPQIRQIVEGADMRPKEERQTLMFSATFPRDIQILAADFLRDYVFLSVGRVGSTSENIKQVVEWVEDYDKRTRVMDLLRQPASSTGLTLIFVETKRAADQLDDYLYSQRIRCTSIHGDRSQAQREDALKAFRSGETNVMVATAVAARGLDIPNVTHVINYDLPTDIDDYVHRIGRTGRAGNVGLATSFFNDNNRNVAKGLIELLKEAGQPVPDFLQNMRFGGQSNSFGSGGYRPGRGPARGGYSFSSARGGNYDHRSRGDDWGAPAGRYEQPVRDSWDN